MKIAVLDIGTNSIRLLVANLEDDRLYPLARKIKTTRLGEGVGNSHILSQKAMERTLIGLTEFMGYANQMGAQKIKAVATSAVREANNREEFIKQAKERCGLNIDVISGDEEAYLGFLGVKKGLNLAENFIVVDLGGGSTEIIFSQSDTLKKVSLPVGAVRATELGMYKEEILRAISVIPLGSNLLEKQPLVLTGGTATSLAAIKLGMTQYQPELIHGHILRRTEIEDILLRLNSLSLDQRKTIPGLQPARADIMPQGTLIILLLMDYLHKKEAIVSESDLLEGLVWKEILE
ncbi:MAG: Ppx/GppA family phosphatase [Syntrophomonadaceae bacterium]